MTNDILNFLHSLAEGHKKKGNDFFKSGDYYQALDHYSKAIGKVNYLVANCGSNEHTINLYI